LIFFIYMCMCMCMCMCMHTTLRAEEK
jgi:hypothetical protein